MIASLIRLSASMAIVRLLGISMPVVDLLWMTHVAPAHLPAFLVGVQWSQIGVVACGSVGVVVMTVIPRCMQIRRVSWLPAIKLTSITLGILIALSTLLLALLPSASMRSVWVILILSVGMIPLVIYSALAAFNQANGQSRLVVGITMAASIINAALDAFFVHTREPALSVAMGTLLCWVGVCACMLILTPALSTSLPHSLPQLGSETIKLARRIAQQGKPGIRCLRILAILAPDFLAKCGFVTGMSILLWWLSFRLSNDNFGLVGVALNYMNVVFVVMTAISNAFRIVFLERQMRLAAAKFSVAATGAIILLLALFTALIPLSSRLYLGANGGNHQMLFLLATIAVSLHGLGSMAITYLRFNNVLNRPPQLMLLTFPCMAAWYGIFPTTDPSDVLIGILVGNGVAAFVLCLLARRA